MHGRVGPHIPPSTPSPTSLGEAPIVDSPRVLLLRVNTIDIVDYASLALGESFEDLRLTKYGHTIIFRCNIVLYWWSLHHSVMNFVYYVVDFNLLKLQSICNNTGSIIVYIVTYYTLCAYLGCSSL